MQLRNIKSWFLLQKSLNRTDQMLTKNEILILCDIYFLTKIIKLPSIRQISIHLKFSGYNIPSGSIYNAVKKLIQMGLVIRNDSFKICRCSLSLQGLALLIMLEKRLRLARIDRCLTTVDRRNNS